MKRVLLSPLLLLLLSSNFLLANERALAGDTRGESVSDRIRIKTRIVAPVQSGQSQGQALPAYVPGQLHVQVARHAVGRLQIRQAKDGGVFTGLAGLDALNHSARVRTFGQSFTDQLSQRPQLAAQHGLDRWYLLEIAGDADVDELARRYAADPDIEAATPVVPITWSVVPDDPNYPQNWGHNNAVQLLDYCWGCGEHPAGVPVGTLGFDANADVAWDGSAGFGDPSLVIAIIDTGVDVDHPDLNIVPGFDYIDNDNNPDDLNGHGTGVAGVAAAIANNGIGAAGVAGGCGIMGLRTGSSIHVANALMFAANNGASVVNMAFEFAGFTNGMLPSLDAALSFAHTAGLTLVASSGNFNLANLWSPADHPNVIAVGAASPCGDRKRSSSDPAELSPGVVTDPNGYTCEGERWWGSNYGANVQDAGGAVDVIAPTVLPTTDIVGAGGFGPGSYYQWFNGTSCASPYAAGVCALIRSTLPSLTPDEVRTRLRNTARDITNVESGSGWDRFTGYGMVDAAAGVALPEIRAQTNAAARVSVMVRPDGLGTSFDQALMWNGVPGSSPLTVDASVTVEARDSNGDPVAGLAVSMGTSLGGLTFCPGFGEADAPTGANGGTNFVASPQGSGFTTAGSGEVMTVSAGALPLAATTYKVPQLYASSADAEISNLDIHTGAATAVCTVPIGAGPGFGSTDIEWDPILGAWMHQRGLGQTILQWDTGDCGILQGPTATGDSYTGLEFVSGQLYGSARDADELRILDPITGTSTLVGGALGGPNFTGLAWDGTSPFLYGVTGDFLNFSPTSILETINLGTAARTVIGDTGITLGGLEMMPDGLLYGGGQAPSRLWRVDPTTGAVTEVGATGMVTLTGLATVLNTVSGGFDIQFNSPDIIPDGVVNLGDIGPFSADLNGAYDYRSDYFWDGLINLADVGPFSAAIGVTCPTTKGRGAVAKASGDHADRLGVYFDLDGETRALDLTSGQTVEAYVLAKGPGAQEGLQAWEARLATSQNVVVEEWILPEGSTNFVTAPDFAVGLGGLKRGGGTLLLATLRLRLNDGEPARIDVMPGSLGSLGPEVAVVALAGSATAADLRPVSTAAAYLNDPSAPVFAETQGLALVQVNLRNAPNPFNPATEIHFNLQRPGSAEVRIYDVAGRVVRRLVSGSLEAGAHSLRWNGADDAGASVGSGQYFYRLLVDGSVLGSPGRMSLVK